MKIAQKIKVLSTNEKEKKLLREANEKKAKKKFKIKKVITNYKSM